MGSFVLSKRKITSSIGAMFSFTEKFLETAQDTRSELHGGEKGGRYMGSLPQGVAENVTAAHRLGVAGWVSPTWQGEYCGFGGRV